MLPFRHNDDDVLRPRMPIMHLDDRPSPPPPPQFPPQTVPDGTPQFSILPTISCDAAQFHQVGTQGYHLPSLAGGLGEAPMQLFSGSRSYASSGSPSPRRSRSASTSSGEYRVNYQDSDDGTDRNSLDNSSVFTYSSIDSETSRRKHMWRRIQYSWRKRLRVQKRSSKWRHQHEVESAACGREGVASSLPDLGLYKTWDSRTALKEMKELKRSMSAAKGKGKAPERKKATKGPIRLPNIKANLRMAIEEYAGHGLLDDGRQSRLYGYLLDTIARLRGEIMLLRRDLMKPPPGCPKCAKEVIPVPTAPEKPAARFQILHRVFCANDHHFHDRVVYEDEPTRKISSGLGTELKGEKRIMDIEQYCAEHKDISFILFKEHTCVTYDSILVFQSDRNSRVLRISSRKERLLIVSEVLLKAFNQVAKCSPQENVARDIAQMPAPYLFLYHHRDLLSEYASTVGGEAEEHISLLLAFINEHYNDEYKEANSQFAAGIATKEHIAKLYCPNGIIVDKTGPKDRAYVVRSWLESKDGDLELPCWSWEYDGSFLRREDIKLRIIVPSHLGSPLSIIGVYPIAMADDENLKHLRERGRKFWSIKGQYFTCYSGNDVNKTRFHNKARFMIDTSTYFRMHRSYSPPPSNIVPQFDPWPPFIAREAIPDDLMILLLRPTVYGFDLHEKKWVQLYIEQLHPIQWNKKAFDQLVLEKKTKELVKALIEVRISAERMEDVIEGKGNGLIMLLHGSPGTGKTLTAESVAEIAEKPLYRVTCGDLGTNATNVEKYMQTVLYLGKIWGCVLLLDEADVFLEERTTGYADLERNSLVSVFLRILEYYDGILILTSNRVGIFDEAFKSRIQVALHYEDHTASARKAIWKNFLNILESSGANADISELEEHLEELSEEVLNGRQIRNAMTTARQLALHKKQRMDWTHLEQALSTAKEFDRYLNKVQGGHSDKQWARDNRWR